MVATQSFANLINDRQTVLELYHKLYEKTPKYEYKKRIEELKKGDCHVRRTRPTFPR